MGFHDRLLEQTKLEQEALFSIPFVVETLQGNVTLAGYRAFLGQAYHHVRHTVPLLMATGAALPVQHRWLLDPIEHYVREEIGHEEWILDDIAAAGGDADETRSSEPDRPCELMVAYAYDTIQRRNPLGFFGMVHVLEGASVRGASQAAVRIQKSLGLGENATTYLSSHGEVDREHVDFFRALMDRIEDTADQDWIIHCARSFFQLYGDIFRGLPVPQGA